MSQRLKSIIDFPNVAVGDSRTLPHGLHNSSKKLTPDSVTPNITGVSTIVADDTNVTVTNLGTVPLTIIVLCESWHSIERAFGDINVNSLVPQPFVAGKVIQNYLPVTDALTLI